jgi:protein-disulfide isomerase
MLPFAGLALLLVLGVVWKYLPKSEPAPPPAGPSAEERNALLLASFDQMPVRAIDLPLADFALGPEEAPVTVVEFSDFECPYCRRGAEAVREVHAKHPDDVRLVFKNFPIDTACHDALLQQLHPFACRAAFLARCAGASRPERFWQAHDALFAAPELSEEVLAGIPLELSIPQKELARCMASPEVVSKVKEDISLGRSLGVTGTPTFFVNGRRAPEYNDGALLRIVEHVLAATTAK